MAMPSNRTSVGRRAALEETTPVSRFSRKEIRSSRRNLRSRFAPRRRQASRPAFVQRRNDASLTFSIAAASLMFSSSDSRSDRVVIRNSQTERYEHCTFSVTGVRCSKGPFREAGKSCQATLVLGALVIGSGWLGVCDRSARRVRPRDRAGMGHARRPLDPSERFPASLRPGRIQDADSTSAM